ncbi:SCO family protein [Chitinilyticum litopenaei]|uniref:SCO family protein n=1 Tax=Chitinilyticum litopenaei TaxID=1121276 RepID=UPI0004256DBF|nr:SCO family protein [Chitinilyticum litopenaei]
MRFWTLALRPVLLALGLLLAACAPAPVFQGVDITGQGIGGDFRLQDADGRPRTLADYRGKVVALFFGYTHCPDVCPTTLAEMRAAFAELGPAAQDVQVLFVSVDPARDKPELLKHYVPAFHPSFVGLTGSEAQIAAVAKTFQVIYQKQGSGESYTVDHTAATYLLDRSGKTRVLVNYGSDPGVLLHDLRLLLQEDQ